MIVSVVFFCRIKLYFERSISCYFTYGHDFGLPSQISWYLFCYLMGKWIRRQMLIIIFLFWIIENITSVSMRWIKVLTRAAYFELISNKFYDVKSKFLARNLFASIIVLKLFIYIYLLFNGLIFTQCLIHLLNFTVF